MRVYRWNHRLRRDLCWKKIEENECSCDWPRFWRPSVEIVAEVDNKFTANLLHTAKSDARSFIVPKTALFKILRNALRMCLYFLQRNQMLQSDDVQLRFDFANHLLNRCDEDNNWPLQILWTDEAYFSFIGFYWERKHTNYVYWVDESPLDGTPTTLHQAKMTVWYDIANKFIRRKGDHIHMYENVLYHKYKVYNNVSKLRNCRTAAAKDLERWCMDTSSKFVLIVLWW